MIKKLTAFHIAFMMIFMKVSFALADEGNPISKLKSKFKFKWEIIDSFGFIIAIFMLAMTIYLVWMFLRMLWELVKFGIEIATGKRGLNDKDFWIRLAIALAIVIGFWSGLIFEILELFYGGVDDMDLGGGQD